LLYNFTLVNSMSKLLLIFIFLLPGLHSNGFRQEHKTEGSYPNDFVWIGHCPDHKFNTAESSYISEDITMITIPLKRAGNLILVEAVIDSLHGNLILDTGSRGMVLNSIYFRQGWRSGGLAAGGITGTPASVTRTKISTLQISDIAFSDVNADITDLGHIEKARNTKILGFFGLSLLSEFEVVLDLKNSVMELHRIDYYGNRISRQMQQNAFDLDLVVRTSQDVMFLDASIGDRKLTFCLDTGAEANVISSHLPSKVLNTISIFRRSSLKGVGSQSVEVLYGIMNDFSIAGKQIHGMQTIITNLSAMSESYNIRIDGMLGCDFFEKGIFCMNLKKKNLRISFYEEDKK
jgi:hypothetical protein